MAEGARDDLEKWGEIGFSRDVRERERSEGRRASFYPSTNTAQFYQGQFLLIVDG